MLPVRPRSTRLTTTAPHVAWLMAATNRGSVLVPSAEAGPATSLAVRTSRAEWFQTVATLFSARLHTSYQPQRRSGPTGIATGVLRYALLAGSLDAGRQAESLPDLAPMAGRLVSPTGWRALAQMIQSAPAFGVANRTPFDPRGRLPVSRARAILPRVHRLAATWTGSISKLLIARGN